MAEKRGRKRKNGLYFGPEQEEAVVRFLNEPDYIVRNKIYNDHLREPLNTMIESIIRRYKLYRKNYSFENLHSDTLSYLILKSDKFNPEKGKRAYSYYGTICKHYILGLMIKDAKYLKQTIDFDSSVSHIHNKDEFTYQLADTDYELSKFIKTISDEIKAELAAGEDTENKKKMTDNEKKLGTALVDILDNWETIFENLDGGSKYNKNSILATIRENTNLTTKDIRISMRRYNKIYALIKTNKIDEGYL
jgi:hypothetical protein